MSVNTQAWTGLVGLMGGTILLFTFLLWFFLVRFASSKTLWRLLWTFAALYGLGSGSMIYIHAHTRHSVALPSFLTALALVEVLFFIYHAPVKAGKEKQERIESSFNLNGTLRQRLNALTQLIYADALLSLWRGDEPPFSLDLDDYEDYLVGIGPNTLERSFDTSLSWLDLQILFFVDLKTGKLSGRVECLKPSATG